MTVARGSRNAEAFFIIDTRREWEASAVTEDYLDLLESKNCLQYLSHEEVQDRLGFNITNLDSKSFYWAIEGIDPTGDDALGTFQVKTGGSIKYRTPKGGGSDATFLPLLDGTWANGLERHKRVVVTEGAKKAACLISLGIPAVSVMGVNSCLPKTANGEDRPNLTHLYKLCKEKEIEVLIAFDMDCYSKEPVQRAVCNLAEHLRDEGIAYRVLKWNVKYKGVDDYLASKDEGKRMEELDKVLATSLDISKWEKQFEKEALSASTPTEKADLIADAHRHALKYHLDHETFRTFKTNCWESVRDKEIMRAMRDYLKAKGMPHKNNKELKDIYAELCLALQEPQWESIDSRGEYIAFNNGLYNVKTREFREHQASDLLLACLDYDYREINDEGKTTIELLKEHSPVFYEWAIDRVETNEKVELLLAVLYVAIARLAPRLQKFVLLEGRPGTGKGTFLRLVEKAVGEKNTEWSSISDLSSADERARLLRKPLLILGDEETHFKGFSVIAKMTGGDKVSASAKYQPSFSASFIGLLLIAANGYPFKGGEAHKLKRRCCAIKFDKPIANRMPSVEDRLLEEIPNLVSVVTTMSVERVTSLVKVAGTNETEGLLTQWEYELSDSVAHFVDTCCIPAEKHCTAITVGVDSEQGETPTSLWGAYKEHCITAKFTMVNENNFCKRLKEIFEFLPWDITIKRAEPTCGMYKKRVNCYQGIALNDGMDVTISELLRAEAEDAGLSGVLSEACQGSCQGSEPLLDIDCQGCQGSEDKSVSEIGHTLAYFFEGELLDFVPDTPDTPDNLDRSTVSTPDTTPDTRVDRTPDTELAVGSRVTKVTPDGHKLYGWFGYIRFIRGSNARVWWEGDYDRKKSGVKTKDSDGTYREKLTTEPLELLRPLSAT